jgi:hypothetical protein
MHQAVVQQDLRVVQVQTKHDPVSLVDQVAAQVVALVVL